MPVDILMPALSPTMEKGTLARWLKAEGDRVSPGDIVAEVETDKATMELDVSDAGILCNIRVGAGTEDVPVNQVVATLLLEGEDNSALEAGPAATSNETAIVEAKQNDAEPGTGSNGPMVADLGNVSRERRFDVVAKTGKEQSRKIASPLARRIAKELGMELASLVGTGPLGRIIKSDVEKYADCLKAESSLAEQFEDVDQQEAVVADRNRPITEEIKTLRINAMRRTIARRVTEAKQTVPHFYLTADCNIDALAELRTRIQEQSSGLAQEQAKPTLNDFVVKAWATALRQVPEANVTFSDEGLLLYSKVGVGVAISVDGGVVMPVIPDAASKSVSAISEEIRNLAKLARQGGLSEQFFAGGTSALSNLGMIGVRQFDAIINPPHSSILAVGCAEERCIVKDGKPHVARMVTVTLSADHRAIDGALGAQLLAAFKTNIEKPYSILV